MQLLRKSLDLHSKSLKSAIYAADAQKNISHSTQLTSGRIKW